MCGLWNGIDARPVLVEHLHRRCGSSTESVVGAGEGDMELSLVAAGSQVSVNAPQCRWGIIAPATVVNRVGRDIAGQVSNLAAGFDGRAYPIVGTAAYFGIDAMIGKAILHLERERAANRVEAEDRIAGNKRELIDSSLRDKVPIDDITEDLVDAHPILVDGKSLRRADHRRSSKATVIEIELKLVPSFV